MCRDTTHGGRRCPTPTDPVVGVMRQAARRARDNRALAAKARAESRRADAKHYEALAAKADWQRWDARDSAPVSPVAKVVALPKARARDRKALLAQFAADGFTVERGYGKQVRTIEDDRNDALFVAYDERGRLVGALGARLLGRAVSVHDLWVIEPAQHAGVGRELMGQAANLSTHLAKDGRPEFEVTSALVEAMPFYKRLGARFAEPTSNGWIPQTGRWGDPRAVHALALQARYASRPPAPVISVEEERSQALDDLAVHLRRVAKTNGPTGLRADMFDPANPYSYLAQFADMDPGEVLTELRARRVPVPAGV